MDEKSVDWQKFDPCQLCVFFCPANGQGYYCSHPEVKDYLKGVCKCNGRYFLQTRSFKWPPEGDG